MFTGPAHQSSVQAFSVLPVKRSSDQKLQTSL